MDRYLITHTLLSSWSYVFSCWEDGKEAAYEDFLRTLNRLPSEETEAMRDGRAFEEEVYKEAAGLPRQPHPKWESGIKKVAAYIRNAPVQVRVKREIQVDGVTYLVYGILDALKAGVIYDVKYVTKSFGSVDLAGKYLDSSQHPAYFYMVPEAYEFNYLVSDGTDLYKETYTPANTRPIADIISEFIRSIDGMGLLDLYKEKWLAR